MGQVGRDFACSRRAADLVTHHAGPRQENLHAAFAQRVVGRLGRADLVLAPALEFFSRMRDYGDGHMGMLPAAEFRALTAKDSILGGLYHEPVLAPRNDVHLAGETGHPKGMNDVRGLQLDQHRLPDRNMDFIRRCEAP